MTSPCAEHQRCGCEHGGACCLSCPLPACVFDVARQGSSHTGTLRSQDRLAAVLALREQGLGVPEVAARVGISPRQVSRLSGGRVA